MVHEVFHWVGVLTGIAGMAVISFGRVLPGMILYTISNVAWITWAVVVWDTAALTQFGTFLIFSTYGIWRWSRC